jgi:predicted anti-sigma-YlaC factor YlaD
VSAHHYDVKCRDFVERVTDLLEGGIGEGERVRLEQHVVWCEMCANYVDQMRHATRLLAHADPSEAAPGHDDVAVLAADLWRRAAGRGGES